MGACRSNKGESFFKSHTGIHTHRRRVQNVVTPAHCCRSVWFGGLGEPTGSGVALQLSREGRRKTKHQFASPKDK